MNNNHMQEEESDILLNKNSYHSDIVQAKDKNQKKGDKNNLMNLSDNATALKENEVINDRSQSLIDKREKHIDNPLRLVREDEEIFKREIAKKHKYYPTLHFLAFLLCIVILYFAIVFHKHLQEIDLTYFYNIKENWKKSPLQEIYKGAGDCEQTQDNILSDFWPGLQQGCVCEGKIYKGECPKNKANCTPLPKLDKKKFTFWQANNLCARKKQTLSTKSNGKIDATKNKNLISANNNNNNNYLNYFDLEIADRTSKTFDFCPTGLKNCGIIDSFGNFLCIPLSESCPVNNINVRNYMFKKNFTSNGNNNLKINELNNSQLFPFSNYAKNEKAFNITNTNIAFSNYYNPFTSKIPVEFITSFDQPCKNPYYINANFYVFYLDPFYGKQKCLQYADDINPSMNVFTFNVKNYKKVYFYDSSYALLDRYPYRNMLIDNGIYDKFKIVPLSYIDQLSQNIGLYARNYFGISAKCHKEIKEKKLAEITFSALENLDKLSTMIPSVLAILSLDVINMGLLVYFFITSINLNFKSLEEVNNGNYLSVKFFTLFLLLIILSFITIFILGAVNAATLISYKNLDIIFGNKDCVDNFTHDIYIKYFSMINTGTILMVVTFCFSLALLVCYILYSVSFMKNHEIKLKRGELPNDN